MASALEIVRVDPFDDTAVDAWWQAYAVAKRADMGEDALIWTRGEARAELQQRSATTERRAYLALGDDGAIGSGSLALGLKDNLHSGAIGVTVPPQFRRRGIGSALLAHIEAEARAAGRRTFRAETAWPASAPADGSGEPGREFARRHGYEIALGDLQNKLALPVSDAVITSLLADAPADGYEIRGWVGAVPEEFVADWAALDAILDTEAPTGELDMEASSADVDDHRADEELQRRQGRTSFGVVALASDGRIAAYTQIVVSSDDGNAYQWGTLVRREDRANRLGLRIKLENLRMLQQHSPDTPRIYTYNAESNRHMLAVNTRLGFVATGRLAELQKRV
ncbi:GNAT family N-acetyltransferase [Microbacterium sp. H1-D42]|uniref:GNAT family N-acetyltransferase n=1 Tax=Microbacterium sp. H1-D42 TaxID=2925844 RepID=UPI001F5376A7|nr:GNAT family N-acetyltransferase [Microbacterium sp. H1-D42]UNK70203.1 GNAT family N-acetyltransferase [Microbacterium sp. H1-D42]